jgi:hypothetical protein
MMPKSAERLSDNSMLLLLESITFIILDRPIQNYRDLM